MDPIVVAGALCYVALALVALWGAFSVSVVWRRVALSRFRSEEAQTAFLDQLEAEVANGNFEGAVELCEGDSRAIPQLALMALTNRNLSPAKLRGLLVERFTRDVLADLEFRVSWVYAVIKSAPMIGLFGTVLGMMGAFSKLAGGDSVEPANLAQDIQFALITTAIGLAIAIPLMLCTTSINVRIRKLEDLVGAGLTRIFDFMRPIMSGDSQQRS